MGNMGKWKMHCIVLTKVYVHLIGMIFLMKLVVEQRLVRFSCKKFKVRSVDAVSKLPNERGVRTVQTNLLIFKAFG